MAKVVGAKAVKKKAKKPAKLSPEEKKDLRVKNSHKALIRNSLRDLGFKASQSIADKEFTYDGATSDFDDAYILDNVVILVEYTTSSESNVTAHLKGKHILYQKIAANGGNFLQFLSTTFPNFGVEIGKSYLPHQFRVKILYCSLNPVSSGTKALIPEAKYFDYNVAKYFQTVAKATKHSGKFELFEFLGLRSSEVGENVKSVNTTSTQSFQGSVLPEGHSNYGPGFKVVSFYANPQSILKRAYVLRKYGWREGETAYQRMIDVPKIANIRKYLKDERRVFINNIIVTLAAETKILDNKDNTILPASIVDTCPAKIQLPADFNSIGLIDGQHRVLSYHEGGTFDDEISAMRDQQNLLITGIIFPEGMSDAEKLKFEAKIFLEINSNQARVKSDLRQEINAILNPFSAEAIARGVIRALNDKHGPLQDQFERFFFEQNKLKTTSIVSFGLRPLVSPFSDWGLFGRWDPAKQVIIKEGKDDAVLSEYIEYCRNAVNTIFSAFKKHLPNARWTADRSVEGSFLNTTNVNGVISLLRRIAKDGDTYDFAGYDEKLNGVDGFTFDFKSSQYGALGEKLYEQFFKIKTAS